MYTGCPGKLDNIEYREIEVTESCKTLDMGDRNQTHVFNSQQLSHLSFSVIYYVQDIKWAF